MNSLLTANGCKSNLRISLGILALFVILVCRWSADAFNIDINYPIQFVGQQRSYFGYSVALLNNSKGRWVIVGAPRANSTYFPTLIEPGDIFKCNVDSKNCSRIQLDTDPISEEYIDRGRQYKDKKDNMWLGVSVDTTPEKEGRMVACAHLWKNVIYKNYYLANGVCYTLDEEFDQESMEKLSPLIAEPDQILATDEYKFAYAQQGISAHFIKNSDALLLGAPGVLDWKGSSVYLSRANSGIVVKRSTGINTYADTMVPSPINELHHTSYFGYAVTSGQFSKNGPVMLAIGAPRQSYKGKIYIVEIKNNRYDQKVDKIGEQMGEYFGAALSAVDLNNDGLDDLLVGAPMHSKYSDEGKVYIFINKGNVLFQLSPESLMGSQKAGARFGSSIAVIGDVNMDGYLDVAIGAPFEDDRGAVYIYHGNANGLKSEYQQKIEASHGSTTAKGFGMSIAKGMDLDGNNYPDLAIGAYASSETIVFRARPVVYLSGTIIPNLSQLNMDVKNCKLGSEDVSCFNLDICLSYKGQFVPDALDVNFSIQVDNLKGNETNGTRVFIQSKDKLTNEIQEKVTLLLQKPHCQLYNVYALNVPKDYMTPIQVALAYHMVPKVNPSPGFCANCPLLDESQQNQKIAQVRFMKHCGIDEKCDTDLRLTASIRDFSTQDVFEIGSKNSLVLHTEIFNAEEAAYSTILMVDIPSWMTIDQKDPFCEFTIKDPHKLLCVVANPLKSNAMKSQYFNLNLEKIPVEDGFISINLTVRSDSHEHFSKLQDNNVSLEIRSKAVADITIIGSTPHEQAFYEQNDKGKVLENATANFSHVYEIYNNGPSPVHQINVNVRYPANSQDGGTRLLKIISMDTLDGQRGAVFGSCEGMIADHSPSPTVSGPQEGSGTLELDSRRRRDATNDVSNNNGTEWLETNGTATVAQNEAFILNCSTASCETISCVVGPFAKDASATLILSFMVKVFNLRSIMGKKDIATIFTEGQVTIDKHQIIIQPDDHKPDYVKVSTDVKSGGPPPPKELASWIIPVSIAGGILLFILLTAALVKLGFFRRKKKEEMERLMGTGPNPDPQQNAMMES